LFPRFFNANHVADAYRQQVIEELHQSSWLQRLKPVTESDLNETCYRDDATRTIVESWWRNK